MSTLRGYQEIVADEIRVRPYRKGDEISINNGFNQIFGHNRSSDEWWWKFDPENQGCRIIVAVNLENQVVAQYSALRFPMQIDDLIVYSGQPVDVFCLRKDGSTQHRIYLKTVLEFFKRYGSREELSLLFGFPGKRALRLGQLKLGYGEAVPVRHWCKLTKNNRFIFKQMPNRGEINQKLLDDLWHRVRRRYPVSVVRDGNWLSRRYLKRPNNAYYHLIVSNNGRTSAWAVLRFEFQRLKWVDLLWDGENEGLLKLEDQIMRIAAKAGIKNVEMWLAGDAQAADMLSNIGWESHPHPEQLHLVARSFQPEIDSTDVINRLYMTMGDSDLV